MVTKVVNLKSEKYDIYIGRPSKWGNPFYVEKYGREESIRLYKEWIMTQTTLLKHLPKLRGKTLGCYCKPLPCHGDILVRMINVRK
jgi:hypothetical protein